MLNTILGTKQNMSQVFVAGVRTPVTNIFAGPCVVTHIKDKKKDGYWAIQIGFGNRKIKNTTKPMQGHLKGVTKKELTPRFLREVVVDDKPDLKVGEQIRASDIFSPGDIISVSGISKGKGFAGTIKRWGFSAQPRTHGQSDRRRAPGSIGLGTTPGRVFKGKHMAGRMGGKSAYVKNLQVISVDDDTLSVSGSVPGTSKRLLVITKLSSGKLPSQKEKKQVKESKKEKEIVEESKDAKEKEK